MGKIDNCLRMFRLLYIRGKMTIKELANELDVHERMVRIYRDKLEQAGIYIDSIQGKHGGYILNDRTFLPAFNFTDQEIDALIRSQMCLDNNMTFPATKQLKTAIEKIQSQSQSNSQIIATQIISHYIPNVDYEEEQEKFQLIQQAITKSKKLVINYISLTEGKERKRIIYPYELFIYQGFWYVIAFCTLRQSYRHFKLVRIKKIEKMTEGYKIDPDFRYEDYVEKQWIYNKKKIRVKLLINPPQSVIISEGIWGEEQKITKKKDGSILFEALIPNSPELVSWILSLGPEAEVIQPIKLREKIIQEIEKYGQIYKI